MSKPEIFLHTAFLLNNDGRIISTRDPEPTAGPAFILVRDMESCVWAISEDVPRKLAEELEKLASEELPVLNLQDPPIHEKDYLSLVGGRVESGPAYRFPEKIIQPADTVLIEDSRLLARNFLGLTADRIPGRVPIMGIIEEGNAVSVCVCARRSDRAAEAGLETAESHRGRGFGTRVTAAWALAIRASGLIPLYSTSWTNNASLAVARKLDLVVYASTWSFYH